MSPSVQWICTLPHTVPDSASSRGRNPTPQLELRHLLWGLQAAVAPEECGAERQEGDLQAVVLLGSCRGLGGGEEPLARLWLQVIGPVELTGAQVVPLRGEVHKGPEGQSSPSDLCPQADAQEAPVGLDGKEACPNRSRSWGAADPDRGVGLQPCGR